MQGQLEVRGELETCGGLVKLYISLITMMHALKVSLCPYVAGFVFAQTRGKTDDGEIEGARGGLVTFCIS
jgi:hypothetical protein